MQKEDIKFGGFRVMYSRPPLFMVVTAPTAEQLTAKVAALDAIDKALQEGTL